MNSNPMKQNAPLTADKTGAGTVNHTKSVVVSYQGFMKWILAIGGLLALRLLYFWVNGDDFVLHLVAVVAVVVLIIYLVECLTTQSITLTPNGIEKRRLFFGKSVIPAQRAIMTTDNNTIRFHHGSTDNLRERITIRLSMISNDDAAQLIEYAKRQYAIKLEERLAYDQSVKGLEGSGTGEGRIVNALILQQFSKGVDSYKMSLAFMAVYAGIVVITVGVAESFTGLAPQLPAFWLRSSATLLALVSYFFLKRLDPAETEAASLPATPGGLLWAERFTLVENRSFTSALLANLVALLGLVLFLLFGNLLDVYLFLAVGAYYSLDFYPRLSDWERVGEMKQARVPQSEEALLPVPRPARRRSLQVSLVLMGTLAVTSYGESQQYLYKSKKDCLDDWGSEQSCQEPAQGSNHYHTGHYYGPRYGGSGNRGLRSIGTVTVSRGGFGSLGGFHGSFGG